MKKLILCIMTCLLALTISASAKYEDLAEQVAQIKSEINAAEDIKLLIGKAVFTMSDNNVLLLLEESGNIENMNMLKTSADAMLDAAAGNDMKEARTQLEVFCGEFEKAIIALNETAAEPRFVDVAYNAWYYNAVEYTVQKEIFYGMDENHFAPDTAITRGMFLALMGRIYLDTSMQTPKAYTDVADDAYYAAAVNVAKANGILDFIEGDKFCPDQPITREELVTVLRGSMKLSGKNTEFTKESAFVDSGSITNWAKDAVSWAAEKKIVNGFEDGTFRPQETATRAQVAQIFYGIGD